MASSAQNRPPDSALAGECVVFTGKLSTLSRRDARSLVLRLGGLADDEVTARTTMLVVGDEGYSTAGDARPETDRGTASHKLRKAALINEVRPGRIRVLREDEFCELAGVVSHEALKRQYYAWRDILAMYPALREDHLRYLHKWRLVQPAARTNADVYVTFADLVVLREASAELAKGTPFRAVVRALDAKRTGQLALDFRGEANPAKVVRLTPAPPTRTAAGQVARTRAEDAFLAAAAIDDGDPARRDEVARAYHRALELDPNLVPAIINLGNLYYAGDQLIEAQALYERALTLEDDVFEAHFNLGNVQHDMGRLEEARTCYARAVAIDPDHAEAHFYLAVTLEKLGRSPEAKPHWRSYRVLAPDGEWVELAREFSE